MLPHGRHSPLLSSAAQGHLHNGEVGAGRHMQDTHVSRPEWDMGQRLRGSRRLALDEMPRYNNQGSGCCAPLSQRRRAVTCHHQYQASCSVAAGRGSQSPP